MRTIGFAAFATLHSPNCEGANIGTDSKEFHTPSKSFCRWDVANALRVSRPSPTLTVKPRFPSTANVCCNRWTVSRSNVRDGGYSFFRRSTAAAIFLIRIGSPASRSQNSASRVNSPRAKYGLGLRNRQASGSSGASS